MPIQYAIEREELPWTGLFKCEGCGGESCEQCDEGLVEKICLLQFDIIPGEAPIVIGPPEHCDPGSPPEVTLLKVLSPSGIDDWTELCANIDDAEEFICENWEEPEPDYLDAEDGD